MDLRTFEALPAEVAERELLACCAAPRWAAQVVAGRPYGSVEALQGGAAAALTDADLDAAMAGHPRIGDRQAAGQARREQGALAAAAPAVVAALAEGNRAYEERFGYVYLVRASGRSAEELLAILQARLGNDPARERAVALAELAAINRIRLGELVGDTGSRPGRHAESAPARPGGAR